MLKFIIDKILSKNIIFLTRTPSFTAGHYSCVLLFVHSTVSLYYRGWTIRMKGGVGVRKINVEEIFIHPKS